MKCYTLWLFCPLGDLPMKCYGPWLSGPSGDLPMVLCYSETGEFCPDICHSRVLLGIHIVRLFDVRMTLLEWWDRIFLFHYITAFFDCKYFLLESPSIGRSPDEFVVTDPNLLWTLSFGIDFSNFNVGSFILQIYRFRTYGRYGFNQQWGRVDGFGLRVDGLCNYAIYWRWC